MDFVEEVTVRTTFVEIAVGVRNAGSKEQVVCAGSPEQENVIVESNPFKSVTLIVSGVWELGESTACPGNALIVKSGGGLIL
jgi:hypothetical protein